MEKVRFINGYIPKNGGTYQRRRLFEKVFDGEIYTAMNRGLCVDDGMLYEALIASYDIFKVKDIFNEKFIGDGYLFKVVKQEIDGHVNYCSVIEINKHVFGNEVKEKIIEFMKFCGYDRYGTDKTDGEVVKMYFKPRFQADDCTDELRKKCRFLYHLTSVGNKEKILAKGFVPKSENMYFNYPDRVYFVVGNNLSKEAFRLLQAIWRNHGKKESVIIMVDLEKVPDNVVFYTDFDAGESVFTHDNIGPQAVAGIMSWKELCERCGGQK